MISLALLCNKSYHGYRHGHVDIQNYKTFTMGKKYMLLSTATFFHGIAESPPDRPSFKKIKPFKALQRFRI